MTADDLRPLLRRHAGKSPRYTSYPTANHFGPVAPQLYEERLAEAAAREREPLSLYVHVPFCRERCHFCACAVVASPMHDRVAPPYLDDLLTEARLTGDRLRARRRLAQLHLGGGTPTYLEPALLDRLYTGLHDIFEAEDEMESSIEVDPRVTTEAHLDVLARHGVNRISVGVQDLEPRVQEAIGRIQPLQMTEAVFAGARARGITELNVDLVYGLPYQTARSMVETVDAVAEARPGRVALYGYAHVPWMRGNQRRIETKSLPVVDDRLDMFLAARERFEALGYRAIGLDHFALPDDPLTIAHDQGRMHRNFMGYTLRSGTDMIGLGTTAIGDVAGALMQNTMKLTRYHEALAAGRLPVERGMVRTDEDVLRGRVIADLMCRGRVVRADIERDFDIEFDRHFASELRALAAVKADGLVHDDEDALTLTDAGRIFVRTVAMAFDEYLRPEKGDQHSIAV